MHWQWKPLLIATLIGCVLLAGCVGENDAPDDASSADNGPNDTAGAPKTETPGGEAPAAGVATIQMDECAYLYGHFPMPWAEAEALVDDEYHLMSWVSPGDETLATVMAFSASCAAVEYNGTSLGAQELAVIAPRVHPGNDVVADAMAYLAYTLHSHETLADAWSAWAPAGVGTIDFLTNDVAQVTGILLTGEDINAAWTVTDPGAISGLVSGAWGLVSPMSDVSYVAARYQDGYGSMGMTFEAAFGTAPFDMGGMQLTGGLGNGHGTMRSLIIQPMR